LLCSLDWIRGKLRKIASGTDRSRASPMDNDVSSCDDQVAVNCRGQLVLQYGIWVLSALPVFMRGPYLVIDAFKVPLHVAVQASGPPNHVVEV
jgi:hypothetical protein